MAVDQANSSKLLWKISGALSAMVIVAAAFMYLQNQDQQKPIEQNVPSAQMKSTPKTEVQAPVVEPTPETPIVDDKALVKESILTDAVPQNASIAKEEIAKLEDIQDQLLTQQDMLAEQSENAEQLIQLKEEQIKILEEQLSASN